MANKNDPLEELLQLHKKTLNGEIPTPPAEHVKEKTPAVNNPSDITPVHVVNDIMDEEIDDEYGDNDLMNEIEAEEKANQEARQQAAEEMKSQMNTANRVMPPDEKDMKYHDEAIGFQSEKLSVVSMMVQQVVAKRRIISGGIPETPIPEKQVLGKMAVMGELIDIYHKSGQVITPEFENLILNNWVMPDGTLAIHNINEQGIVIDKLMMNNPTGTYPDQSGKPQNPTYDPEAVDKAIKELKESEKPATININVEKNTPVTVNVDESVISEMTNSNEVNIYVKEVSEVELKASTIVENSNKEGIISTYDSGINDVPVTLPLSGYRCVMRPINWFGFIKLTAPTSQNGSDIELKKWSVIYEHLKNPSIGKFENFEDFMKKTKYQDRELLMWALLVATSDDEETLSIRCGNPKCRNEIKVKYHPREIVNVDWDKAPVWYKAAYDGAVGPDAIKIWESANNKRRRYKLPNTGVIAEVNEPSAYEFVTIKLPLIQELYNRYRPNESMTELDVNDPTMAEFDYLSTNALFISALTIVKNENGQPMEYRYTNWDDIEKIITQGLDAEDSGILLKIIEKARNNVSPVSFRLNSIDCPVCGKHEEFIPINDIGNTLLFQVSRRLSNTQINLIEMD